MSVSPALSLRSLTKKFGSTTAVDGINLDVPTGSLFGLVGPNGAGKTTALSMSVGLLRPDAGQALIAGVDVWQQPDTARRSVGVLPDALALPERLTGREALGYLGSLRGMTRTTVETRTQDLLAVLDLLDDEGALIVEYSAGMRKKIGLALALLHKPDLLVLDEPFESVDPVSAIAIRAMLRRFIASGGTVILSSHVMALVEQLCDGVGVIVDGRVAASGTLEEVRGDGTLEDRFVELSGAGDALLREMKWLDR